MIIVSTWGEGDPPDAVVDFHTALLNDSSDGISLNETKFSVCALGDTSYEQFCETGKQVDTRLEALGGIRLTEREDCDVDYEDSFDAWITRVVTSMAADLSKSSSAPPPTAFTESTDPLPKEEEGSSSSQTEAPRAPTSVFSKKNPFPATLTESVLLNGTGSAKETLHLEISLTGSDLTYKPGDALAVIPKNAGDVVDALLRASGLDGTAIIEAPAGLKSLRDLLVSYFDCTAVSKNILKKWQAIFPSKKLSSLLDDSSSLSEYLHGRQIVDMIEDFPASDLTPEQLISVLRKLPPRLYSIASSLRAHPEEVHLTVAAVRYHSHDRDRKGVASTFLADDLKPGDQVLVYLHHNKNFKLPEDPATPIIMVGPGTGIAPFRAFLEERAATSADGASWLFFGDQHYSTDFLYQLELQGFLKDGTLDRLDLAFSRDQKNKIYVQHRMLERGAEIFQWLESGACFYVCGDAERMAGDVHEALIEIIATHGGRTRASAEAYLARMKKKKRYQRDVY